MGRRARGLFSSHGGALFGVALLLAMSLMLGACAPPEPPAPPDATPAPEAPPPPVAPPAAPPAAPLLDRHGRLIVQAMEYPWSALGRVNAGGRGYCTGTLIGPSLVLTGARCLYNRVEGRWWAPGEVHFVAGYQRDRYLIHARVAGTEVAPGFVAGAGTNLANAANDWALLTLEAPIGQRAGWLALQRLDKAARTRLGPVTGPGFAFQAGYRRDWAHSLTVKLGCVDGWSARPAGAAGAPCAGAPDNPELPFLLFLDREFRVLANPVLFAQAEAGAVRTRSFLALIRNGPTWGRGQAPAGGPASPVPADTVTRLLGHLGYLDPSGPRDGKARAAAIGRAEADLGLPPSGRPSAALLGRLMAAARDAFADAAEPRISRRRGPPVSAQEPDRGGPSRLGLAGRHEQAGQLGPVVQQPQDARLAADRREVPGRQVGQPR